MRILAVTCYTGGRELVKMTERCLDAIPHQVGKTVVTTSAYGQGAERGAFGAAIGTNQEENKGFAHGMNAAVDMGLGYLDDFGIKPDYVLCFNNDLYFPNDDWLHILLKEASADRVTVPATNRAALHAQHGPREQAPYDVQESSAYCWLVPFAWCKFLKETYGWWLFDPAFFAYGEDNWTAFLLSKRFGKKIFRFVPRSFVGHLRHQTGDVVKPDRKASNRLLVDRLEQELKYPKIRGDLRAWAHRYIAILKPRT